MKHTVIDQFVARFFADEDASNQRSLADYQAENPGYEEEIAQAWRQLQQTEPSDMSGHRIGRFVLRGSLGRGGQGRILLAEDQHLGRQVALKVLSGTWTVGMLERFRREAELASRLEHPNVCAVFDAGVDEGQPWIAMPVLERDSLAARIDAIEANEVLTIIEAIADALDFAHRHGVVHRDVKPGNILFDGSRPLLTDFGVARELDLDADDAEDLTATGELIGTLHYVAPELLEGGRACVGTDVYALGVTLYECLAKSPAHDAPTRGGLIHAILRGRPQRLRELYPEASADLELVVMTAISRDPEDRYPSAAALAEDLRRVRLRLPVKAQSASIGRRFTRWVQREPGLAIATAITVLALSAGLISAVVSMAAAENEREKKQLALDEVEALADRTRVRELVSELEDLQPPLPAKIPALRAWLSRAEALDDRLALHRTALKHLRKRARKATVKELHNAREADPRSAILTQLRRNHDHLLAKEIEDDTEQGVSSTRKEIERLAQKIEELTTALDELPTYRFVDATLRWREGQVQELIGALLSFLEGASTEASLARGRLLLDQAMSIDPGGESSARRGQRRKAWQDCCDQIADRTQNPQYVGFQLKPQHGIVPLGKDPDSGLFEFADVLSGAVTERSAESGKLEANDASGLVFVLIPGGDFVVGAHDKQVAANREGALAPARMDARAQPFERPVAVKLAPFLIAKFEVTQAQWLRWTGNNPSQTPPGTRYRYSEPTTALHPVESVSWQRARQVLRRLGLDLPTSAQWECAARAGSDTVFPGSSDIADLHRFANLADLALMRVTGRTPGADAKALGNDSWAMHAPVGSLRANAFGLHDMMGNVQEWCRDVGYDLDAPWQAEDALRLVGRPSQRVIRGGSYMLGSVYARSAARSALRADSDYHDHGVRPVRRIE